MATHFHRTWPFVFGLAFLFASTTAGAAVPVTVAIQGSLMSDSGGPVSDGGYLVTFGLYASKASPKAS